MPTPQRIERRHLSGFTLIELVIVIVVLGVLAAYATFDASPPELTIPSQAETMASNIRYLQATANAGKRTRLTVTSGTRTYTGHVCNPPPAADCTDANAFTVELFPPVTLDKDLSLGVTTGPATLYFDTLGRPTSSATGYTAPAAAPAYVVGGQKTVGVALLTGHVTVTP